MKLEQTAKYAMSRVEIFKNKYGSNGLDAYFELKCQYNLTNEEIEYIVRKKESDDYTIQRVLEYVIY